jgi:hypothetical protein
VRVGLEPRLQQRAGLGTAASFDELNCLV